MREDTPLIGRWIVRGVQSYWRLARGFHLLVEACVFDEAGRVLLLAETAGGCDLPRGRAHRDEDAATALRRVLRDAASIEVNATPDLSFISPEGRNEQIATYVIRHWRTIRGSTIRTDQFFPIDALPAGTNERAAERIRRSIGRCTTSEV